MDWISWAFQFCGGLIIGFVGGVALGLFVVGRHPGDRVRDEEDFMEFQSRHPILPTNPEERGFRK